MLPHPNDRPPPPLLFIYFREKAAEFAGDPYLRFSDPSTFNDPFEFRPKIKLRGPRAQIDSILKHNDLRSDMPIDDAEIALARIIHSDAAQRYRVLCLTEDPLNLLMWAHYGNKHKGYVLGFDSELITPFREVPTRIEAGPVIYDDTRPIVHLPPINLKSAVEVKFHEVAKAIGAGI